MKRLFTAILLCLASPALAEEPQILQVSTQKIGAAWRFSVTLQHPDTGWAHYADGWRVLDMQGKELGLRNLAHPHEQEQPFTRSLGGIVLPAGTTQVQVQARCLVDSWASETFIVDLK
ncbi:hypothetical protein [Pseudophaeobacter sp.]|uniref:hypothetical protein n=1 Tax=Pseudophaeobacter sp. TaxID=1971739 RepID=UPI004059C250